MIRIRIGEEERDYASADEHWINQQINRRRADGQAVCVRVTIREAGLDMVVSTPTCGRGGGGRPPRSQERQVLELWDQRGLNDASFTGGNLVAFLRQLNSYL